MEAAPLPAELITLRGRVVSLQENLQSLQQENQLLRYKLQKFIARYFGGKKSEALSTAQLELLLAGLSAIRVPPAPATPPKPAAPVERKKAVRQKLPAHLETERVVIEPEEVKQQPEAWRSIGEEVTEELDWKPAQFIKRLYVRPKYVRRAVPLVSAAIESIYGEEEPGVVIAPLPSRLIERGLPGAGLLAQVVISKYEDHLPLYRQEKIYRERHGVSLSRQSLAEWVEQVAGWLRPVYEVMKGSLLGGDYLQADETPIRYLDPDLPGKSQLGYLWTYSRPGAEVVFEWQISRGREGPEKFLKEFRGLLQTDGYGVYASLGRERPELELVGCWAHARRKFVEALEEDRRAAWAVRQIGHLYGIEKHLREQKAGPRLRAALRAWQARPVVERMEKALRRLQPGVLPKSLFGTAIGYALERWTELSRYLEHGRAEIDNNLVENAIRPTAVGKKNFLFIGHPAAGWRSAVIYSVLGTCRRYGVNPYEYLRDVLRRLPDMKMSEVPQITPSAWARARKQSSRTVVLDGLKT